MPAAARAQSVFTGTVKDTSGAVMPGVTVEAASPVLIEKVKSAVTDENGQYRIVDLRPGTLHDDLHASRLQHGDARSRARRQLHRHDQHRARRSARCRNRSRCRAPRRWSTCRATPSSRCCRARCSSAVPTAGTIQGLGQLVVGVTLNVPDVGGSRAMQQTYFAVRGQGGAQTVVLVDGMMTNGMMGDGAVQAYHNESDDAGSRLPDGRRQRRDDHRRRQHEPDSEGRRQPVPRRLQGLQVAEAVAGRQPDRRSARARRHRRRQDRQLLRVERRAGRPDRAQQAVVLRRVPPRQVRPPDRQHLLHAGERAVPGRLPRSADQPGARASRASRTRR